MLLYVAGVEHVGGDMFQSIPKGDAIFMKWILHCLDDDHCLRLLKNCYEAIPDDNGKVIVLNAVISEQPETSDAARETSLLDVLLLTRDSGGKERTKQEFMALATGAGFKGINFVCYQCNFHVMEFFKCGTYKRTYVGQNSKWGCHFFKCKNLAICSNNSARETSLVDVLMLAHFPGGKEPTKQEYMTLATGAGFRAYEAIPATEKVIVIDSVLPAVLENNLSSREASLIDAKERNKQRILSTGHRSWI
ncbi:hypothetical protein JRO89_XS01G0342900 [Xanthoceras sorbifolium]|uniref:O-methyltransferase C-terminal domain-containing protein n=1 Tax=Xanthoceras sorbifolium TaxID=99658 RepID=A0ABQ8IN48_9ROSI|nr:hypothetical protein JRO89_XS01G0342900 [Xanthoceras sorbifolium]